MSLGRARPRPRPVLPVHSVRRTSSCRRRVRSGPPADDGDPGAATFLLTGWRSSSMAYRRPAAAATPLTPIPLLPHEPLYVGIDVGKASHVAGFVSATLLARHERFEGCPA